MSRRLVIAIDCDDVLIETTPFIVDAYNKKFGTTVSLRRAYEPDNPEWGCPDGEVLLERLSDIQRTAAYAVITPMDDAVSKVRQLAMNHELHLITARNQSIEAITMKMLDRYLVDCFKTVEHVGRGRSKGEVCKQIGADILIDDNMRHLISALEHGVPFGGAFHFGDYAWNRHESLPDGIVECANWDQVIREVGQIAG